MFRVLFCFSLLFNSFRTAVMLRRKSDFFVFRDNSLSVKSDKEARKEEEQSPTPFEEYVYGLLQIKTTSAVSEQRQKVFIDLVQLFYTKNIYQIIMIGVQYYSICGRNHS